MIKAFYHTDEETIFQESALYKVKSNSLFEQRQIQNVIKKSHANCDGQSRVFCYRKNRISRETEQLYKELAPYGLLQFVRSGRFCDKITNANFPYIKRIL